METKKKVYYNIVSNGVNKKFSSKKSLEDYINKKELEPSLTNGLNGEYFLVRKTILEEYTLPPIKQNILDEALVKLLFNKVIQDLEDGKELHTYGLGHLSHLIKNNKNVVGGKFINSYPYYEEFSEIENYNLLDKKYVIELLKGFGSYFTLEDIELYTIKSDYIPCNAIFVKLKFITQDHYNFFALQFRDSDVVFGNFGEVTVYGRNVNTRAVTKTKNQDIKNYLLKDNS